MFYKKQTMVTDLKSHDVRNNILKYLKSNRCNYYGSLKGYNFTINPNENMHYLFNAYAKGTINEGNLRTEIIVEYKIGSLVKFFVIFSLVMCFILYLISWLLDVSIFAINETNLDYLLIVLPLFMLCIFKILFIDQCKRLQDVIMKFTESNHK